VPNRFAQLREALQGQANANETVEYAVTKAQDEQRYTLGVMYVPNATDADDEYTTLDELQKATWNLFRSGQRLVKDTHTERDIGELVELVSWPFPVDAELKLGDGKVHKYRLPEGTVWAGVIWKPEAWTLVKSGKLRGYSMGGKAVRMKEASDIDLPRMRDLEIVDEQVTDPEPATKSYHDARLEKLLKDPVFKREYARELARLHAESE
jgi:hypothetical protein